MFYRLLLSAILLLMPFLSVQGAVTEEKLVVLGSGPAGLSTAIFAGQADLNPLVIEGGDCDGQLDNVNIIENFPGFPEGISAEELYDRLYDQAEKFGSRFIEQRVKNVDLSKRPFRLILESDDEILCDALVIALGAKVRWLGIESEKALIGNGVSASAICDAHLFDDQEVIVVGSADSALEQALLLAKNTSKVSLLSRSGKLSASAYLQEKIIQNPKIHVIYHSKIDEILGVEEGRVTGVHLRNSQTQEVTHYPCQGVFVSIGRVPNTELFKESLEMTSRGFLITQDQSTLTNVEGVFAAGDLADPSYRKLLTAAASGCKAAIDAQRYLEKHSKL